MTLTAVHHAFTHALGAMACSAHVAFKALGGTTLGMTCLTGDRFLLPCTLGAAAHVTPVETSVGCIIVKGNVAVFTVIRTPQ